VTSDTRKTATRDPRRHHDLVAWQRAVDLVKLGFVKDVSALDQLILELSGILSGLIRSLQAGESNTRR